MTPSTPATRIAAVRSLIRLGQTPPQVMAQVRRAEQRELVRRMLAARDEARRLEQR